MADASRLPSATCTGKSATLGRHQPPRPTGHKTPYRNLSPVAPTQQQPPSPDSVSLSQAEATNAEQPTRTSQEIWSKALLTGCLAAGAASGVLGALPTVAQAQVLVTPLRPSNNPAIRHLVASSLVTGRIPPGTVEQRMAQLQPEVRSQLETLPPEVQKDYVDLDVSARRWLASQVSGSSDTYLGKVKHRPAFISGKVVIVNIFDVIKGEIRDEVRKGTIPREAQPRINAYLDKIKSLHPQQRAILANALQTEFPK